MENEFKVVKMTPDPKMLSLWGVEQNGVLVTAPFAFRGSAEDLAIKLWFALNRGESLLEVIDASMKNWGRRNGKTKAAIAA